VCTLIRWFCLERRELLGAEKLEGFSLGRKENCLDNALSQSFEGMLIVEIR
jgi:hypothetical protein